MGSGSDADQTGAAPSHPVGEAISSISRLYRFIVGQLLRDAGLHIGQEQVMTQLWERGPQRQADLVKATDSDNATMARTIRRLELAGFVRRTPIATDRRASMIEPTPAGMRLRTQVEDVAARVELAAIGHLDERAKSALAGLLADVASNMRRAAEDMQSKNA